MRILLAGHKGQLGRALVPVLAVEHDVVGADLPEHDITDRTAVLDLVRRVSPDLILNSAAMTNVDGCAENPQLAFTINGTGTQNLALAAQTGNAEMLQVSTNEVFDGTASLPYDEWAPRQAINAYGQSKLAGERYVETLLNRFYIVRTAWLYAAGGRNFPHRIIELADQHGSLRVVDDEVGSPTYVVDLADAIAQLIETHAYGFYHFVNDGAVSRYQFARTILAISGREAIPITAIKSSEWQRASTPPLYAPLHNYAGTALGISLRAWDRALADFLEQTGYHR
ncbi:MAG: dTDP-4-dehydrorhamnose reductase [Anaerolineae bacterium]|nr:dTDP-4-dehydrorhamnose reductase [Anaerolineae bacterium]